MLFPRRGVTMIVSTNVSASDRFRWKELRPMIEPKPPPSRIERTCSKTVSSFGSVAPPEKMTIRRPPNGAKQ